MKYRIVSYAQQLYPQIEKDGWKFIARKSNQIVTSSKPFGTGFKNIETAETYLLDILKSSEITVVKEGEYNA